MSKWVYRRPFDFRGNILSKVFRKSASFAQLTGTPENVTWDGGTNPTGVSITIPSDATAVYMFWRYGTATAGSGLSTATLNAIAPDEAHEIPTDATFGSTTGVSIWYNPSTGSQTLDVAWDVAPAAGEGPTTIVAYVRNGNTNAARDLDSDHNNTGTAVTVTLTTETSDLVLKFDSADTAPGLTPGWISEQTQTIDGDSSRLSSIVALNITQICDSEDEDYSSIVAVSIGPIAAAATTRPNFLTLLGVG